MSRREKVLLIFAIVIIILLFAGRMVFLPLLDSYFAFNKEYENLEHQLEKSRLQLRSMDNYIEKLTEVNQKRRILEEYFYQGDPSDIRLEVLNFLDSRIREKDIDIVSKEFFIERSSQDGPGNVSYSEDEPGYSIGYSEENYGLDKFVQVKEASQPVKLIYRAQIKGDYQQLLSLLEEISSYHKYYSINQLDIKSTSDRSQLAALVVIESYCIEGDNDV